MKKIRNLDDIPDSSDWFSKDKLIPTITATVPIDYVLENSAMVRACYDEGWMPDRLNAMSECDLVKILQLCQITQDQIQDDVAK